MKEIKYTITFSKPYTHYCEVEINLSEVNQESLIFSMPVWAPGSYLLREFSKNVEDVSAENGKGESVSCKKVNKNSWEVDSENNSEVKFKYRVYCNELTVRTSEVNSEHAFISSSGVFMRVKGYEDIKCKLEINLPPEWKKISTGLEHESENLFSADNYDVFIDSPIEAGNQNILEFEIKGHRHFICLYGKGNYDGEILINDFRKIAEEEIKLFEGDIPYESFTFIIHLVEKGGGGLEHLNSFAAQIPRWNFNDEKKYKKFLGLISHEFFHLWNVKRIRPEVLGPFDYDKENYTKELWLAEGFTNFYDNLFLRRSGILSDKEYYEFVSTELNDIMRTEGRFHQSLEESSFDTWIKFYRKDENYNNSQISYYTKGALVAMMLNIEIMISTEAQKSLDDVMRILYEEYKTDNSKGYSSESVKKICEKVSGKNLDKFWKNFIRGTDELPINEYLDYAGLKAVNTNEKKSVCLDADTKVSGGKLLITKVFKGSTAYESGLNFNDEIIAIDGIRMDAELLKTFLDNYNTGDRVKVLFSRKGIISEAEVILLKPLPKYEIEELAGMNSLQKKILSKWLTGGN